MRIKNWKKFQHFKDRKPPWIKLYRDILDDVDINMISDRCFRVIIMLWLIASDDPACEGNLPPIRKIAFRLRMSEMTLSETMKELTEFIEFDDIDLISTRYQDDAPETYKPETYKPETEKTIVQKPKAVFEPVDSPSDYAQAVKGLAGAKEGLCFEPGVQIPQDDEKDAGKGQETQMQGKPEKPRKAKKAKADGEPKINAWGIWIDVCRERGLKDPAAIGPDLKASKEVGKAIKDRARMEHVYRMFLQDRDPWLLEHGHALRNIGARINRYLNDSGGVGIPGEVWADDAEAEAIIEGRVETPF